MIKTLAAGLTLLMSLAACTTPVERTATGDIPAARI
jgi:hypothetical protein